MALSIKPLESIFNLNSRLFINALDGVTEEQAKERISDHNNPLNWLATHTVWARYNTCMLLGKPAKNPYGVCLIILNPTILLLIIPAWWL